MTPTFTSFGHLRTALMLFLLLLSSFISTAQPNSWQWARSAVGQGNDEGTSICTDASGNVIVAGSFESPALAFGSTTLINASYTGTIGDIFVTKYDPSGNVLWSIQIGDSLNEILTDIDIDASGNVFLTGTFYGAFMTVGNATLTNSSIYTEVFLIKLDASGNLLWAKSLAGSNDDSASGVTSDAGGNVFISGYFNSPALSLGTHTILNATNPYPEVYVAKYDPTGNVLWAKNFGSSKSEYARGICTDANGNLYVSGSFESPAINFASQTVTNSGSTADAFLAKYSGAGNELWLRKSTGPFGWIAPGGKIDCDGSNNVLMSGVFTSSTITFGSITLTLNNTLTTGIYVTKYDPSGNCLWAKSGGGSGFETSSGVHADATGNVFITGHFDSPSVTFGAHSLTHSPGGGNELYLVKYDGLGNALWLTGFGNAAPNSGSDVCTNGAGNIYLTGSFESSSLTIGNHTLTNASSPKEDMFVAKFSGNASQVGIAEGTVQYEFRLFPNPFSSQLVIQTDHVLENVSATVSDALGRTVIQTRGISGQSFILSREGLPAGVYFLQLNEENKTLLSRKLIISDWD